MAISPLLAATTTPTPDTATIAEATCQADLDIGRTQNAAYFATITAKLTATSRAHPPTATPTQPPTATPAEEDPGVLNHEVLVHHADVRTCLDEVDQINDVVLAGDSDAFRQKINLQHSAAPM